MIVNFILNNVNSLRNVTAKKVFFMYLSKTVKDMFLYSLSHLKYTSFSVFLKGICFLILGLFAI